MIPCYCSECFLTECHAFDSPTRLLFTTSLTKSTNVKFQWAKMGELLSDTATLRQVLATRSASFSSKSSIFAACLLAFRLCLVASQEDGPHVTSDALYAAGKEAYGREEWFVCANRMERAIHGYNDFVESLTQCRRGCREKYAGTGISSGAVLEFAFFDTTLKRANCIAKCRRERVKGPSREHFTDDVAAAFESLKLYDYLQICAYRVGQYETAAGAAYTYLLAHQDHRTMRDNVRFYRAMTEMKPAYFRNMESKQHQTLYKEGVDAYNDEDYGMTIDLLERALLAYFEEAERCDAMCESSVGNEVTKDLYMMIADHWTHVLACRMECPAKLATEFGQVLPDYLAEQYNYLQFAYYKVNDLKKAAETVASFFLFKPEDGVMLENKAFYLSQPGVVEADFQPSKVALVYYKEQESNAQMMTYINSLTTTTMAKGDLEDSNAPTETSNRAIETCNPAPMDATLFGPRDDQYYDKMEDLNRRLGVELAASEEELGRANRIAVNNLLTQSECAVLIELGRIGAVAERERERSPPHKQYKGLTVERTIELVRMGTISESAAHLYLRASESARSFLAAYYNVQRPLYFHTTHLACRTALRDKKQKNQRDQSDSVHSDDCFIQPDGTCLKTKPAGDLTGLLYLSDDFEGGDFFWRHQDYGEENTVRPKCGRLIGFESSDYYGEKAISRGHHCVLTMSYTFTSENEETAHGNAPTLLDELRLKERSQETWNKSLKTLSQQRGYDITFTESQLNGTERFVADSVATKEDGRVLLELIHIGAMQVDNDGHQDIYPNSDRFTGMTLLRGAELAREHEASIASVELFLHLTDFARDLVRAYFDLHQPLYHHFTHLLCRTSDNDADVNRLRHQTHSDNCLLQADGSCLGERPAYTERDYSAVLYLNDNFEGGEFIFTHSNLTTQVEIKPRAGRLIGFTAGQYHGVKAVSSGQRCAIALWFTLDRRYSEAGHDLARNIIDELKHKAEGPEISKSHEEL